eukprot:jgi/Tetstr1/453699/TSEL_040655.t1
MYFNTVVKEFVDRNKITKNEASETLLDRFTDELKALVNNDKQEQLGKLELPFLDKDAGKCAHREEVEQQVQSYLKHEGVFGRATTQANAKKMAAAEWWHQYGGHVPDMQLVAVRCLAQIARACGAERGHKEMNFIKSKVRNRLTIPMTEKLIYTRHNIMQLERRKRLGFREEPLAWYLWDEEHDDSMEVGWGDAWGDMT